MSTYNDFIEQNSAPYSATKIGVYNSNGAKVGEIPLGDFKPSYGERLYRFGILSDVHNQSDQSSENTADLQHALDYFNNKESVCMTCICGDISQNGATSEFQLWENNVQAKSPNTPVYTTVGNHDATSGGLNTTNWKSYTGHDRCFEFTKNNDHFLFFGMNKWSLGSGGTPYLDSDIDWLEDKLEEYRNERCFVFTHLFFPTRAGNLNNIYPSGNWLGGNQLTRIQALNDRYLNSIWFSGHSHWKWYLQKYQDRANIYRNNCGWCVHIPSCASPIDSDGSSRVSMNLESEGGIVDVYENYIDIRGMDLKNTLYLPIAHYRLDTTITNIPLNSFSITNNLTHISTNNSDMTRLNNRSYISTLTCDTGYEISSITVTMAGVDITSSVYANGVINIPNVTGNVIITAIGVTVFKDIPLTWEAGRLNSSTGVEKDWSTVYKSIREVNYIDLNLSNYLIENKSNGNYGLSDPSIIFYDSDKNFIKREKLHSSNSITVVNGSKETKDITGIENACYMRIYGYPATNTSGTWTAISTLDETNAHLTELSECLKVFYEDYSNCYNISYFLDNISSTNNIKNIDKNGSYNSTITANMGYEIGNVTITMGEVDITSTVYANGVINIPNVTGNVIITAQSIKTSSIPDGYELISADMFTVHSGSPTVTQIDDTTLEIVFPAKGNKFYLKPSDSTVAPNIYVGEVTYSSELDDTNKHAVGLILGSAYNDLTTGQYVIETIDGSYLAYTSNGFEFNLSSSKYTGEVPLTVTVKNFGYKIN